MPSWFEREIARIERRKRQKKYLVVIAVFLVLVLVISGIFLSSYAEGRRTAIIRIDGTVVTGQGYGGGYVGSEYVGQQLRSAADDPLVEAVVLRVISNGGTPTAAQEIIRDVEYVKQKKPLVVSMGDIAASAAYQIASHADRIYAGHDTITGSIGSIWIFYDYSQNLEDEGISVDIVKSGEMKDMTSSYRQLTGDERDYAQRLVNESFDYFINDVIEQRDIERSSIEDARLIRGDEALELGLIDEIGNLYDAIEGAHALAA
jgi:protease-4